MYSAVRVDGRRLYKEARAGREVQRSPREVTFHSIQLLRQEPERWDLRMHCSSGTYLRALAHDIGQRWGYDSSNTKDNFEFSRVVRYRDSKDGVLPCVT